MEIYWMDIVIGIWLGLTIMSGLFLVTLAVIPSEIFWGELEQEQEDQPKGQAGRYSKARHG